MAERRLSFLTALTTFGLIVLGGIVHGTGSSLACPDWPTCYGSFFPEMKGGIFWEHSHRIVGSLVGILSIATAWVTWRRRREDAASRYLAVGLVLGVIVQGVLGGLTVIHRLPTWISSSHLSLAMLVFAGMVILWLRLCGEGLDAEQYAAVGGARRWVAPVAGLVYLQLVVGSLVRHTGAGLVCLEIPFCDGTLWPSDGSGMLHLHMTHRNLGYLIGIALFGLVAAQWRPFAAAPRARRVLGAAGLLVAAQIGLGLWSVTSFLQVHVVTTHLAGGALLWALLVSLLMLTRPLAAGGVPDEAPVRGEPAGRPAEAV